MAPSGKIVGSLPGLPAGGGRAVPAAMILRLQQIVGNREVQRFLFPRPPAIVPPPPPPRSMGKWFGTARSRFSVGMVMLVVRLRRRKE